MASSRQPSTCENHILTTPPLLSPEGAWPGQHPALSLLRPTSGSSGRKLTTPFQWRRIPSLFITFWFTDVIEKVLEELLMERDRRCRNSCVKTKELPSNWHPRKPRGPRAGRAPSLQATWRQLQSPWKPCWAGRWALVGRRRQGQVARLQSTLISKVPSGSSGDKFRKGSFAHSLNEISENQPSPGTSLWGGDSTPTAHILV